MGKLKGRRHSNMMTALDEYIQKDLSKPGFVQNPPLNNVFQISALNNYSKNDIRPAALRQGKAIGSPARER